MSSQKMNYFQGLLSDTAPPEEKMGGIRHRTSAPVPPLSEPVLRRDTKCIYDSRMMVQIGKYFSRP